MLDPTSCKARYPIVSRFTRSYVTQTLPWTETIGPPRNERGKFDMTRSFG